MITVTYSNSKTAVFDADNWVLLRGVSVRQETTFTADVELRIGEVPVAVIGQGTYYSIVLTKATPP